MTYDCLAPRFEDFGISSKKSPNNYAEHQEANKKRRLVDLYVVDNEPSGLSGNTYFSLSDESTVKEEENKNVTLPIWLIVSVLLSIFLAIGASACYWIFNDVDFAMGAAVSFFALGVTLNFAKRSVE